MDSMTPIGIYLTTVCDDRFGRKDGKYKETQNKIRLITERLGFTNQFHYEFEALKYHPFYTLNQTLLDNPDAARNGRAYKPYIIQCALERLAFGEFLVYTDCSPEIWKWFVNTDRVNKDIFNLELIKQLTIQNDDFLTAFVKWDNKPIPQYGLGIHTHKNFTLNRCMDKMGMRFYEDAYMPASGMICIRKTPVTVDLVNQWLKWNLDDECCALGKKDVPNDDSYWQAESHPEFGKEGYKFGHRHDQSILGLLLASQNRKAVDIIYNTMHPYNFLQFCRIGFEYRFIDLLPKIKVGDKVVNKQGTELKVWRIDTLEDGESLIGTEDTIYVVGALEESCYGASRETLKLMI